MIHQLILNTLLACQPKIETETPNPVVEQKENTPTLRDKSTLRNNNR